MRYHQKKAGGARAPKIILQVARHTLNPTQLIPCAFGLLESWPPPPPDSINSPDLASPTKSPHGEAGFPFEDITATCATYDLHANDFHFLHRAVPNCKTTRLFVSQNGQFKVTSFFLDPGRLTGQFLAAGILEYQSKYPIVCTFPSGCSCFNSCTTTSHPSFPLKAST